MANDARRGNSPQVIQETIENPDFVRCLEQALSAAVARVYEDRQPVYLPGCAGQFMYYYAVDSTFHALQDRGFHVQPVKKQLRLNAHERFECPVWLRFGLGKKLGNSMNFNWPKYGIATKEGVLQNQRYFELPYYQQSLFALGDDEERIEVDPSLNLWIMYTITKEHLGAYLGIGTQYVNDHTIHCEQIAQICHKPWDLGVDDDISYIPSAESDYSVDFGEKTGTE